MVFTRKKAMVSLCNQALVIHNSSFVTIWVFIPDNGCFRWEQQLLGQKLRVFLCSELLWALESNKTLFCFSYHIWDFCFITTWFSSQYEFLSQRVFEFCNNLSFWVLSKRLRCHGRLLMQTIDLFFSIFLKFLCTNQLDFGLYKSFQ